ncbi:MAG: FliH/SctL family protein [Halanaerobium sp.]|nr:FliH/SctL family protein [Halanaerobium sp.]
MSKVFKAGQVRDDQELARILEDREDKEDGAELNPGDISLNPDALKDLSPELRKELREHYLQIVNKGSKHLKAAREEAKEVEAEARQLLEQAKEQAEARLEASKEELEELRKKAYQDGREEGKEAGRQEALAMVRDEFAKALSGLEQLQEEYQARIEEMYKGMNEVLVTLSLTMARKIIQAKLELEPHLLVDMVEKVLSQLTQVSELNIRVNPDDYRTLSQNADKFAPYVQGDGAVRVIKDAKVSKGGFILETPDGGIDGRLDTRLEMLEDAVREVVWQCR